MQLSHKHNLLVSREGRANTMDPLNQQQPTPPVAPQPPVAPVQPAPVYQQPIGYPGQASVPGKALSIAGFSVALASIFINLFTLGIIAVVGLGLSIAGRIQSKKGGKANGLALAGIIISSIVAVVTLVFFTIGIIAGVQYAAQMSAKCDELGVGTHQVDVGGTASTLTCTANGFDVKSN